MAAGAGPQLPPDSTGKVVGAFSFGSGPTIYLPASVLTDLSGNALIGQAAMAASLPVVIASNQSAVPISAASLPLPTGASTAAKQAALGTAGTPSADVLTVQGVTSMIPFKVDGSAVTQPVNNAQVAGTAVDTNSGVKSAGTQRVVLATDQPQLTNAWKVDGSAVTQPVSVAVPTAGGYSISRLLAAATTNATSAKASAGQVYGWYLANAAAYTVFFKLYNKASAPTVGTDTPAMTIPVPAGSAANIEFENGIAYATGIAYAITKLVADSDTTAVAANDLVVNLFYK